MSYRITDRDLETLDALDVANADLARIGFRNGWARPMDCGAWNGSHHSKTLQKLALMGFVEMSRSPREAVNSRPGIGYKISEAGRVRLVQWHAARRKRA